MVTERSRGGSPSRGLPCPACGSVNTSNGRVLRRKPNLLYVMLFGWLVLMIRAALAVTTDTCADCGHEHRYKSIGSWVAVLVLIVIVSLLWVEFEAFSGKS